MDNEKQLARLIFHSFLSVMKNTLDMEEMSYRELGRNDPRYKTFKKHLMHTTYNELRSLFETMKEWNMVTESDPPEDVKDGYKDTKGGGSGFVNSKQFAQWLNKQS